MLKYNYALVAETDRTKFETKVQEYLNKGYNVCGTHVITRNEISRGGTEYIFSISLIQEYHSDPD